MLLSKAFDENLATETIMNLIEGNSVQIPVYDKMSYRTMDESITISRSEIWKSTKDL